jgi:hypothetical protein
MPWRDDRGDARLAHRYVDTLHVIVQSTVANDRLSSSWPSFASVGNRLRRALQDRLGRLWAVTDRPERVSPGQRRKPTDTAEPQVRAPLVPITAGPVTARRTQDRFRFDVTGGPNLQVEATGALTRLMVIAWCRSRQASTPVPGARPRSGSREATHRLSVLSPRPGFVGRCHDCLSTWAVPCVRSAPDETCRHRAPTACPCAGASSPSRHPSLQQCSVGGWPRRVQSYTWAAL